MVGQEAEGDDKGAGNRKLMQAVAGALLIWENGYPC
jgi:hypothetical protein